MQSQSLIWWQGHICHPNIDAISAETNVLDLIPTCNVCSNMTWQKRRSSFALQRRTGSATAPTERRHNQIPVLQVLDVSFTKGPSVTVLNKWALIQRRGDKPHRKWNLGRGKTKSSKAQPEFTVFQVKQILWSFPAAMWFCVVGLL